MKHLVDFLETLQGLDVGLYVHDQALDTSTPAGEMFFHVASAFAPFERRLIQERVKAGLARAKASGQKLGRPFGWTVEKRRHQDKVLTLHANGLSSRKIAAALGMSQAFSPPESILKFFRRLPGGWATISTPGSCLNVSDSCSSLLS